MKKHYLAWIIFAAFVVVAALLNGDESVFISNGPYPFGKYLFWGVFLIFTGYTYHCSANENLFKTIKVMQGLFWGRQIGIDLYIGLILFIDLVGMHQTFLIAIIWAVPILAFGNLATLLYISLHYDTLISLLSS